MAGRVFGPCTQQHSSVYLPVDGDTLPPSTNCRIITTSTGVINADATAPALKPAAILTTIEDKDDDDEEGADAAAAPPPSFELLTIPSNIFLKGP